jgi:hypothetical protein
MISLLSCMCRAAAASFTGLVQRYNWRMAGFFRFVWRFRCIGFTRYLLACLFTGRAVRIITSEKWSLPPTRTSVRNSIQNSRKMCTVSFRQATLEDDVTQFGCRAQWPRSGCRVRTAAPVEPIVHHKTGRLPSLAEGVFRCQNSGLNSGYE